MDIVVFVGKEKALMFVNKVTSFPLLSVEAEVILLLIWIIALAISSCLETDINKIHHPSLMKTYF